MKPSTLRMTIYRMAGFGLALILLLSACGGKTPPATPETSVTVTDEFAGLNLTVRPLRERAMRCRQPQC